MSHTRSKELKSEFRQVIQASLGPRLKQVVLFGSRARGDESSYSDWDILIVVDEISAKVKETIDEIAGDFLFRHNAVLSIFPVSEENYLNRDFDPFLRNVREEGIVL